MELNFDTILKDLDGKPLKERDDKNKEIEITLKVTVVNALLGTIQTSDRTPEPGTSKMKRYELARKVNSGGIVTLTVEEISSIKERVGLVYSTMIVGSVYDILENKQVDSDKAPKKPEVPKTE